MNQVATTPPPPPGAPQLPEGWAAEFSSEHQMWYYVNSLTKESVWTFPTAAASAYPTMGSAPLPSPEDHFGAPGSSAQTQASQLGYGVLTPDPTPGSASQPAYATGGYFPSPPNHNASTSPVSHVEKTSALVHTGSDFAPQDVQGVGAEEGDRSLFGHQHDQQENDRGLGKMAMGLFMGGALEKVLGDKKDKLKIFGFGGSSHSTPPPPPQPQHHGFSSFLGGVGAAAGAATAVSAAAVTIQGHHAKPPPPTAPAVFTPPMYSPPPQQHQYYAPPIIEPAQPNYNHYAPQSQNSPSHTYFAGVVPSFGGGGGEQLNILSANFGGADVTEKVKDLIKDNRIDFNDGGSHEPFNQWFGDTWGWVNKVLCVLYQFGHRPMELAVVTQKGGVGHVIDINDYVRPIRRAFITETGPVIAVVWGRMENRDAPVSPQVLAKIASFQQFEASNDFIGFDGYKDEKKALVVFVRRPDGTITNIGIREGGSGTL